MILLILQTNATVNGYECFQTAICLHQHEISNASYFFHSCSRRENSIFVITSFQIW